MKKFMKTNGRFYLHILLASGLLWLAGCTTHHALYSSPGRGNGPPPHAPAHGYRHKQKQGVDLVFDSGIGVYVVVDRPDYYFDDGYYYRLHKGKWQYSTSLHGNWKPHVYQQLPPGLQKKYKAKGKNKNKNKGRGRGKGKYKNYEDHGSGWY